MNETETEIIRWSEILGSVEDSGCYCLAKGQ